MTQQHEGVLICGEVGDGKLASITGELLGAGRRLADELGEKLGALLIGGGLQDAAREAIALGADEVYLADEPALAQYHSAAYTAAVAEACEQLRPSILLLGQTDMGMDIAPRVAARLGTGLSTDCIGLRIDPATRLLVQTRPVYGGNALAEIVCRSGRPQMATVRPRTMSPLPPDASRKGEIAPVRAGAEDASEKARLVQHVKQEVEGIKLEDAEVVVAGGAGLGSAEDFKMLWDLARVLGGAVGGTKVACEEGWLPSTLLIGQTGKVVSPSLYVAVGLSGAVQHIAGVAGAKNVVAINTDPEAHIFKVAQLGVVGDCKQAVPALTKKLKELLEK